MKKYPVFVTLLIVSSLFYVLTGCGTTPTSGGGGGDDGGAVSLWYVDSTIGSDTAGTGTIDAPFKTITHAIVHSNINDIIYVQPGTYSTNEGEIFPLVMKDTVSLVGSPESKGTLPTQTYIYCDNSTLEIVAANNIISGFVIKNVYKGTSPYGTGIYAINVSPRIEKNTIVSCESTGIFIGGQSSAYRKDNDIIYNNKSGSAGDYKGGIRLEGTADCMTIEANLIRNNKSGGINILVDSGSPLIILNTITSNCGDVANIIANKGTPKIRHNEITYSTGNGIIVYPQSKPDIGTVSDPGWNKIIGNAYAGIYVMFSSSAMTIEAVGNTWEASSQNSHADGSYSASLETGPQGISYGTNPDNYGIGNSNGFIQF